MKEIQLFIPQPLSTSLQIRIAAHETLQELKLITKSYIQHKPNLSLGLGGYIQFLALQLGNEVISQIDTTYTLGLRMQRMLQSITFCCEEIAGLGVTHSGGSVNRKERKMIYREMVGLEGLLYSWQGSWRRRLA